MQHPYTMDLKSLAINKAIYISLGMTVTIAIAAASICGDGGCFKPSIKDDFCGIHINFQYCKCAFHNDWCPNVGMTQSEAKTFVYSEYNKWVEPVEDDKYGIIEKNGKLYLNSRPGEVLSIKTEDLPGWARGEIATVGAGIAVVGPPDTIVEGDANVLLNGFPIARVGDGTAHGGSIVEGSDRIFVNGKPVAFIGGQSVDPMISPGSVPYVGGPITHNPS